MTLSAISVFFMHIKDYITIQYTWGRIFNTNTSMIFEQYYVINRILYLQYEYSDDIVIV